MPPIVCAARVSYKKLAGVLELTTAHLQWTQDGKTSPAVRVPHVELNTLFCSKEGAAQVKLKVGLVGDDAGHNFTFIAPHPVALSEREALKRELTNIVAQNKGAQATAVSLSLPGSGQPLTPSAQNAPTPRPMALPAKVPDVRAPELQRTATTDVRSASSPTPGPAETGDFRLRKKVLIAQPELAELHRTLVLSGQITEAEFWEGREHLLQAQAAADAQRRGRPGTIVDPRPETVDGDIKIVITPQLVHDIFEEYPVVQKAYSENVPKKLSEAEFWKRYFQSKLFNAHRASIRSSATQHVVKADPIFDRYLEKDDDDLEPRRLREEGVETFIDLGATNEDHGETGNEKDVTMQAGRQRATLPLIRKFNEHSERLLKTALGPEPAAKRRRLEDGSAPVTETYYRQIELDDLRDPEAETGLALQMQDRERYFDAGGAKAEKAVEVDVKEAIRGARESLAGWGQRLGALRMEKKAGDAALVGMTQGVAARVEAKARKNTLPEGIFRQMTTCQTAANEFLRQFWVAVYPPQATTLASATPVQRSAKAGKMAAYLARTAEKVDAIARAAQMEGVESGKVEVAMKPVVDAVEHALAFHRSRQSQGKPGR